MRLRTVQCHYGAFEYKLLSGFSNVATWDGVVRCGNAAFPAGPWIHASRIAPLSFSLFLAASPTSCSVDFLYPRFSGVSRPSLWLHPWASLRHNTFYCINIPNYICLLPFFPVSPYLLNHPLVRLYKNRRLVCIRPFLFHYELNISVW